MISRILVVADDFSGAAEIATVGVRYGLTARVERAAPAAAEVDLTVIDTDTRLSTPDAASSVVQDVVAKLRASEFELIYKKTDSVLRGPVRAEVEALMPALGRSATLLIPQNPSRGRTIRDGRYEIDGIPLASTAFAFDPEYPAHTSEALELLGRSGHHAARSRECGEERPRDGITIGDASSADEIRRWAARVDSHVLPAGGADFFQMLLEARGATLTRRAPLELERGRNLLICGSAPPYSEQIIARAQRENVSLCPMPDPLTEVSLAAWSRSVTAALDTEGRATMVINRPLDQSSGASQRLLSALTEVVAAVLAVRRTDSILMEGGATASGVCRKMCWNRFDVDGELAAGAAQLRVIDGGGQRIIVKPGSYPWPESVWQVMAAKPPAG